MAPTIVLVSGANRGLGKGLVEIYLSKPDHIVITANRNPEHPTSKALSHLPTGPGTQLIVVKTDAKVEADPFEAVKKLTTEHSIDHIDLVIANAGVSYIYPKVSELKISDLQAHIEPNVYGVVWLYQATLPLLLKSKNPKNQLSIPNAAYAPSKAAIHWLTKRMNGEEEQLNAFVIDPGWCQTDMGNTGAHTFGMEQAPVTVEDSCTKMVKLIETATKESHGGKLWGHEGEQQAW
ncbi:hypothetical protein G7Y89_g9268 [Cudoniella acicularis]|uniref:Uncharacterized protein n=1 Tax=Cudoniella acicularis TaxID=354080 RepID=A0A8H4RHM3_9HELO|nr:hypothetical protein G7Y89_g9268 [Cudoniella acicularis]